MDDAPFPSDADAPPDTPLPSGPTPSTGTVGLGEYAPSPTGFPTSPHPAQASAPGVVSSVDIAAELRVLAALFADATLIDDLDERLAGADFALPAHEAVFEAILAVDANGSPVTAVTVADELTRAGEITQVGGIAAVTRIAAAGEDNPDSAVAAVTEAIAGFNTYVDIVFDRATRRRLLMAGRQIINDAASGQLEAGELIQVSEERVFAVSQERTKSSLMNMTQVVADVHQRMALARSKKLIGVSTGFSALDKITAGLQPGQMVTIAGRPGMGKSVLLTQMCRHIADTSGDIVPIFSYEMQSGEIGLRMLASASGVPLNELMRGYIPDEMTRVVAQEAERLANSPMMIEDRPPTTIQGVRSALRRIARKGKLAAVGLDYIQLIGGSQQRASANRENEVSEVARTIKLMADEFGVPMLTAAQLNRGVEARGDKRPMLADLRESGAIEQDSSLVIMLHRDHMYDKTAPEHEAELIVTKNRNGACITIYADWDGPQVRFRESDRTGPSGAVTLGAPPVNFHGANGSSHDGPGFQGNAYPF